MVFAKQNFLIGLGLVVFGVSSYVLTGLFSDSMSTSLVNTWPPTGLSAASGLCIVAGLAVWLFRHAE